MATALGGILSERSPRRMRALIRGLSSYEFEDAVLSAYDAMRGAGVRVEQFVGLRAAAGRHRAEVAETLRAIRPNRGQHGITRSESIWSPSSKARERIVTAEDALGALEAIEEFRRQAEQVQARQQRRTTCSSDCASKIEGIAIRADHRATTPPSASTCSTVLRRFDRLYRDRKRQRRRARFFRPGRVRRAPAGRESGNARTRARAIRPRPDGRIPGHQRPAGALDAVGAPAGQFLCGGRHQPIDLRFPACRAGGLRAVSGARSASGATVWWN